MDKPAKTIAVFGGSFNPLHLGHVTMGTWVSQALKVDEVWMLFSTNPLKDPSVYPALSHRMEMGRIMARHHPEAKFIMSDIEDRLGIHETFDVLTALQTQNPNYRFVWVMGIDNLLHFDQWKNPEGIFENFPVALLRRPPYTADGNKFLEKFSGLNRDDSAKLAENPNGWVLLDNPLMDMSSHAILDSIRQGKTAFGDPGLDEVAAYIRKNGLYGVKPDIAPVPPPPAPF